MDAQVRLPTCYPGPVGVITRATNYQFVPPAVKDLRQHPYQSDTGRLDSQGIGVFVSRGGNVFESTNQRIGETERILPSFPLFPISRFENVNANEDYVIVETTRA